jgi:hypothetical protein
MQADPRPVHRTRADGPPAWLFALLGLAVLGGVGGVWWFTREPAPVSAPATAAAPVAPPAAPAEPAIRHPVEAVPVPPPAEPAVPLPALGESDAFLFESLAGLVADPGWRTLLAGDFLIQRFVATVDNLPRRKLAPHLLPVRSAPATLRVEGGPDRAILGAANYARYDAYVRVFSGMDAARTVQLYVQLYPLFQQAYRELGQPDAYFNDRLVEVLDHLIAAPDAAGPVELVRPKVFWEFADPALEARSAGEKLMIRIGPAHATTVRARLREFRALLAATPPVPAG